jgi:tetratricopeptide (TPR) repeat protein
MDRLEYLDFEIKLEKREQRYTVSAIRSPAGEAKGEFTLPFSDLELENLLLKVGRTRRGMRRIGSPEWQAAKALGGKLFEAVCKGDVRGCFKSSLDKAALEDKGLRIKLRLLDTPELADLPWEYLYNRPLNRFLSLSTQTPIVRYIELPEPIRPLAVKPPLCILVMVSSPSDDGQLDVEREKANLQNALSNLEQQGMVKLEWLEEATLRALLRRLRQGRYHIFHFIGHGGFDERTQDGLLLMKDGRGRGRRISGQHLGVILHDHRTLRLAVLNACEGARSSRTDPFAGTATTLVQQGIPAVVAMQFEITDEAAIVFASEFYAAIADGYPVDASLSEARRAIFVTGNDVEWGTPVLYMRSPDGVLFDVTRIRVIRDEERRAETLYQEGMAELERKQWQDALYKFDAVLKIRPNHKDAIQERKEALYHRGNSLLQEGEYEKAIYDFDAIITVDPIFKDTQTKRANALYKWGITLEQTERFEEAIYKFEAILKAIGSYKDTEMKLAEAKRQKRLSDLYAEALRHSNTQRWREAIEGFKAVLEIDHTYKDASALLDEAKHQKELASLPKPPTTRPAPPGRRKPTTLPR